MPERGSRAAPLWVEQLRRERQAVVLRAQLDVAMAIYQAQPSAPGAKSLLETLTRYTDLVTDRDIQPEWFDARLRRRMEALEEEKVQSSLEDAFHKLAQRPGWSEDGPT